MRRIFAGAMFAVAAPVAALAIGTAPALAAPGQSPLTVGGGQSQMAPVPTADGCYLPDGTNWLAVDCLSQTFIAQHIPTPEALPGIGGGTVNGQTAGRFTVGLVAAQPEAGDGESDSKAGSDSYSLQDNTFFDGNNGQLDSVQFTQQVLGGDDFTCVWQVDVTSTPQVYTPTCVEASDDGDPPNGAVEGYSLDGTLGAATRYDHAPEALVVAPDMYGLGASDNWNNNSGSILGYGDRSQAVFTPGTEQLMAVEAGSCQDESDIGFVPFSVTCKPRPVQPLAYEGNSPGPLTLGASTAETNNLIPVSTPKIFYPNPYTAGITYVATTSGSCFTGSAPYCE